RALVVDPGTTALVEIPSPKLDEPTTIVDERYKGLTRHGEGTLHVITTRTGDDANDMRRELATTSLADMSRHYLNFYVKQDPNIRLGSPLKVEDDVERNVLVIREHYLVGKFWGEQLRREFDAFSISDHVTEPSISRRTMPLAVQHPVHVRHLISVDLPEPFPSDATNSHVKGPAFRVDFGVDVRNTRLTLDYRYQSLASVVEPQQIDKHLEAIRGTNDQLGYWLKLGAAKAALPQQDPWVEAALGIAFVLILLGCLGAVILPRNPKATWNSLRARLRKRAFTRKLASSAGDSAQSAIPIAGPDALMTSLQKLRCDCGAKGADTVAPLRREAVILGDRNLTVVQWRCPKCSQDRRAYFEDTTAKAA
ncbi:MAG TPA: hypothetical protein VF815_05635, partial [Myxococcaceae bacterium]